MSALFSTQSSPYSLLVLVAIAASLFTWTRLARRDHRLVLIYVAALEMQLKMPAGRRGRVAARLVVTLHADSPVVRCVLEIDNQATDHRLRARLPTGLADGVAVAGAAFGAVARGPVAAAAPHDFPREMPVATAPAHRFVAAGFGCSWPLD